MNTVRQTGNLITLDVSDLSDSAISDLISHVRGMSEPASDTYIAPKDGWTCFHCGEKFLTEWGARLHFGNKPTNVPACF